MMITAARRAVHPTASFMFFRLLAVVFLAIDLVTGLVMGEWAGSEFWLFVLIAEYAATIRTLPPVETSKTAAKARSEEHTSELQSLMRISYAVFCLKKKNIHRREKQIYT